jgi:hypothetical protein
MCEPLQLHGRKFTWSSGIANPTLTKIDHIFVSKEWELAHPHCYLQALSTSVSVHCPLLVTCAPFSRKYRGFRFETSWLGMPGFKQLVQQSWAQLVAAVNKDRVMHIKLARLAKTLKRWNKQRLKSLREEADEAQQRVLQLDQTHDQRPLNDDVV